MAFQKKHEMRKEAYGEAYMKKGGSLNPQWIQSAIKKPGALHKALHVPKGKNIPAKKLSEALHSKNPLLRKRANLAKTLKNMHHGK